MKKFIFVIEVLLILYLSFKYHGIYLVNILVRLYIKNDVFFTDVLVKFEHVRK